MANKDATRDRNSVYNFSAGPGVLPESVLREAQADLLNWKGALSEHFVAAQR